MTEEFSAPLEQDAEPTKGDVRSAEPRDPDLVPGWLAALVLVLLLAVMAVGGFVIRGMVEGRVAVTSPQTYAIEQAKRNLAANPGQVDAMVQLAYAYQGAEQYDHALAEYGRALKIDPKQTAAYYNEGLIYEKLGIDDKALKAFWAVLGIDPTHELAAKELGRYYASKKEYRSLLVAVKPAADAKPEMADLQYLMGLGYENIGHPDWAVERYRAALKYVPDMVEAQNGLKRLGVAR